jgi:hypothetical protein
MKKILITGAAGFLGSHLCDRFIREGFAVIGMDNLIRGYATSNTCCPWRSSVHHQDVTEYLYVEGPWTGCCTSRAGEPDRLPGAADPDAEGRLAGHAQGAGAGEGEGRALPARLHLGGVRRSAGAPAAGGLLGQRQPGRPARGLRRGQALRRGDDDGLPPLPRGGDAHRAHLQHLRPADAPRTTAAWCRTSSARRCAASRSRSSATAARRAPSATWTTWWRASSGC